MPRINAVSFHEGRSIEQICRLVRDCGFDGLELSRPPFYTKLCTPGLRRRFSQWISQLGLHAYGFDCWVEVDPYERFEETLAGLAQAIDWAADLELGLVISHDPWAHVNAGRRAGECLEANIRLFGQAGARAAQAGLQLVLEPHPDTLSIDPAWASDLIDGAGEGLPPNTIGILYDCCHYGVGHPQAYVECIGTLGQRITHLHFSDGDAETYALHLPLGEGVLDLRAIVQALLSVGFNGTLTNDLYNYPLLEDGARRNAEAIRDVEIELGLH